jgi:hypothetical protein
MVASGGHGPRHTEFSLRGFTSTEDLVNHIVGGVLMEFGGAVTAAGCTLGQWPTALSTSAFGSVIAFCAIISGCVAALTYQYRRADQPPAWAGGAKAIMIVYDLMCARQHPFEGWFGSAEDFARQRQAELIRCPICDDAAIEKRPSAQVRVGQKEQVRVGQKDKEQTPAESPAQVAIGGNAEMLKLVRRMIADTENVGSAFPEEARKIHYEEAPKRGIRGQATPDEAKDLRDEGIEFMSLPAILTRDLH